MTTTATVATTISSAYYTSTVDTKLRNASSLAESNRSNVTVTSSVEDEDENAVAIVVAIVGSLVGVGLIASGFLYARFQERVRRLSITIYDYKGAQQKPASSTPQAKGKLEDKPVVVLGTVATNSEAKMAAVVPVYEQLMTEQRAKIQPETVNHTSCAARSEELARSQLRGAMGLLLVQIFRPQLHIAVGLQSHWVCF